MRRRTHVTYEEEDTRVYAVLVRNTCEEEDTCHMRRRIHVTYEEEDTRVYAVLVRNTCVMCACVCVYF
jgi:hypothetical protein